MVGAPFVQLLLVGVGAGTAQRAALFSAPRKNGSCSTRCRQRLIDWPVLCCQHPPLPHAPLLRDGNGTFHTSPRGGSSAQLTAGALREQGPSATSTGPSQDAAPSTRSRGPSALLFPSPPATTIGSGTPGAAVNNGTLVVGGGAPSRRPSYGGGGGRGNAPSFGYAEGGGGGGGGTSASLPRRPSSRASRHQSVEDDLWGWFGDDRPPSETALHAMARGDAAEPGGGVGIGVNGWPTENAGVTVSTLALTERLAKLSAGRVLLDRVRADTRSLASVVTSAVHSAFTAEGVTAAADAASATVTADASCPATRAVHFTAGCSPPGGRRRLRPGAEAGSEAEQTQEEEEEEGKDGGEEMASSVDENGSSGALGLGLAAAAEATGDQEKSGGQAGGLRQRVVEARAEIEGLQREIRRLVREGAEGGRAEETRARVAPLVERRAVLAQAARADAGRMAKRLQEISNAQQVGEASETAGNGLLGFACAGAVVVVAATWRSLLSRKKGGSDYNRVVFVAEIIDIA